MISYGAAGAVAQSTSQATTVAPAYPSGITAGQMLVLIVGQKPNSANGGTVTTPAGWTLAGSLLAAGGYSTTLGAGSGNTNLRFYTKAAAGSESGSLSLTLGTNYNTWAQILRFTTTSTGWDASLFASAEQSTTPSAAFSLTTSTSLALQGQDMLVFAYVVPMTLSSTFSNHALASGVYIAAATEISEHSTAVGYAIGGVTGYARVGNGSASAPVTWSSFLASTSNIRGPFGVLALRESPVVSPTTLDRAYAVESLLVDTAVPVPNQLVRAVESLLADTGAPVPQQRVYAAEALGADTALPVPVQRTYAVEMQVVDVAAAAPTNDVWVWNGTAEVPAYVTVWNGTGEIASTVEVT